MAICYWQIVAESIAKATLNACYKLRKNYLGINNMRRIGAQINSLRPASVIDITATSSRVANGSFAQLAAVIARALISVIINRATTSG